MDGFSFVDIYSTKGIEYLVAVVFFFGFLALQYYLLRSGSGGAEVSSTGQGTLGTFRVPDGYSYHQGHSWMKSEKTAGERKPLVRVGMNDFAQKLVGRVDEVELPPVGSRVEQGEIAWKLKVDGKFIPMLSPVSGTVERLNENVVRSPAILNSDPYGKGWLFSVRSGSISHDSSHLLSGNVARVWMEDALTNLFPVDEALGPVLQDGGLPVDGIAKALGGDRWQEVAMEQLLTDRRDAD